MSIDRVDSRARDAQLHRPRRRRSSCSEDEYRKVIWACRPAGVRICYDHDKTFCISTSSVEGDGRGVDGEGNETVVAHLRV